MDALLDFSWFTNVRYGSVLEAFLGMFVVCAVLINFVAVYAGLSTLLERKIAGHMQARVGPYQVGPHGILQWLADALKLMIKEDIVPTKTDAFLFRLSPYLVFAGAFACWVALPYAPFWSPTSFNIGLLYLLAVSSAGVIGVLMAGWSSGNKWALFGAMRAAAQIVSYEVPVGITLLSMLLIYGTLDLHDIVWQQRTGVFGFAPEIYGGVFSWGLFKCFPFTFIAFLIFYTGALAETNRTPFDIPEAESELVSGYHTEYSGMRFSFFFLAEYANMFVVSAIAVTVFLGGWLPFVPNRESYLFLLIPALVVGGGIGYMRQRRGFDGLVGSGIGGALAIVASVIFMQPPPGSDLVFTGKEIMQFAGGILWFAAKVFFLLFIMIWLRWTLPRYRVDQLMDLCWKKLTPLAFINLLGIGILITASQWFPALLDLFTGGKGGP